MAFLQVLTVWIFYAFGTRHRHQLRAACASDYPLDYPSVDMAAVMDGNYRDVNSSSDLENWMANLPEQLHSVPLNYLTIPGSHNSCSYTISSQSEIAPDNPYGNKLLKLLGPIGKQILYSWSLTQNITTREQLQVGIRYFDLRIATKKDPADENLYLIHGLFGAVVDNFFVEVKEFLEGHRKEVILLHFQHFYNLTDADHNRLLNKLTSNFGPLMCQFTKDLNNLTLESLWRRGYQIIAFYRHDTLAKYHPYLWPTDFIPNPWPNEDEVKQLVAFWDHTYLHERDPDKFLVLQGVGTPQPATVTMHICNSLRVYLVPKVNGALESWLSGKEGGSHGCNVIMSDFVDMDNFRIPKIVVAMNQKLLENSSSVEGNAA
ncbi:unnamed protein product [Ixodes pacificus]